MKIALINENSQAAKNALIEATLRRPQCPADRCKNSCIPSKFLL